MTSGRRFASQLWKACAARRHCFLHDPQRETERCYARYRITAPRRSGTLEQRQGTGAGENNVKLANKGPIFRFRGSRPAPRKCGPPDTRLPRLHPVVRSFPPQDLFSPFCSKVELCALYASRRPFRSSVKRSHRRAPAWDQKRPAGSHLHRKLLGFRIPFRICLSL